MRDSRGPVLTAGLVGLAVGAGVCYCVYRVASQRRGRRGGAAAATRPESNEKESEVKPASLSWEKQQLGSPGRSLLQQVSGMSVLSSTVQEDCNRLHQAGMDLPKSPSGLEPHHIQNLINLLESTEDPTIQEQALITLGNCAAFSRNHDIIRNMGGLSIVGKMLWVPITKVKEKALNALNNLSMNIKNQEKMKIYITKVCEDTDFAPLDSELQLAGLRFLTNMSVTNDYQDMMASSIPCFLHLLLEGNERTQIQVLKVLVNLSANPAMTEHLLNAQVRLLFSKFLPKSFVCINVIQSEFFNTR
ncbi:hypothetical protein lerEdw1_000593 [Lerista edwardsae]|nr:hypothetical protein lerEdw1_000593 [Lerista edwardsae]